MQGLQNWRLLGSKRKLRLGKPAQRLLISQWGLLKPGLLLIEESLLSGDNVLLLLEVGELLVDVVGRSLV